MRHYIVDTTDDGIMYYLDQFIDDKTGFDAWRLSYSKSKCWSERVRGETILTVSNDGNGFKIKWEEKPEKNRLDYSQMRELQLVLTFIQQTDPVDNTLMALPYNGVMRF